MNVECMRAQLAEVYPYPKWQNRVARMREPQIIAIYKNMMQRNELYTHKKSDKQPLTHQITIWEWMKENERNGENQKCETVL